MTKKNKIGRNDPCSCGSGVKYKKCEPTHARKIKESEDLELELWRKYQSDHPTAVPGETIINIMVSRELASRWRPDHRLSKRQRAKDLMSEAAMIMELQYLAAPAYTFIR